jgi:hypothetical protein
LELVHFGWDSARWIRGDLTQLGFKELGLGSSGSRSWDSARLARRVGTWLDWFEEKMELDLLGARSVGKEIVIF